MTDQIAAPGIDDDAVLFHGRYVPRAYADHIRALVATWPDLTAEQRADLRVLLRPVTPAKMATTDHRD